MKQVLVMGGTEFVGKAFLQQLINLGYSVDFLTTGRRRSTISGYTTHIKCNRKKRSDLTAALKHKQYHYIVDISAFDKEDVETLFLSMNHTKLERYLFLSSGSVYCPSDTIFLEDSPRGENSHWGKYGLNKKEAEDFLISKANEIPFVIFRPPYIYGEGNNLYREAYFFYNMALGNPILIPESNTKVQFIHIADVLRTILATFENRHAVCQSYNLAHRETITWKSLMSTFKKITNSPSKIKEVEQKFLTENEIGSKQFFPFRDVSYLMDTTKLTNDGLPTPAINLEKGLERSYKWFKQQRDFVPPRHSMNKVDFILNAYTQ